MKRTKIIASLVAAVALFAGFAVSSCCFLPPEEEKIDLSKMNLVWSDEFNGTNKSAVDSTKWNHVVWSKGHVNNEQQSYVDGTDNCFLYNGSLYLRANKSGGSWKSARIDTSNKFKFKYGYAEARIKMPKAHKADGSITSNNGVWPAFWMMPNDSVYGGWPRSGEIDIMEYSPSKSGESVYGTVHFGTDAGTNHKYTSVGKTVLDDPTNEWHTYGCLWKSGGIKMFYDGKSLGSFYGNVGKGWETYPYDQDFYIILNLAMGGDLGGTINDEISYVDYEIDYVRVYQ